MNRLEIIGNLGRDPEMSYTPSGKTVTKLSVAVNRRYKGADGQTTTQTQWFNVTAWDRLAEVCDQYLRKGAKVYLAGPITSHEYTDRDGNLRTSWEVTAQEMEMLSSRDEQATTENGPVDADTPFADTSAILARDRAEARKATRKR